MSKYTIDSSTLTNIADAIREKTGGSSQITPLEMPAEIANISGGSGAPPIPAFTKTLIATTDVDNAPNNLVFTGDYTTQDFLEISMQNTSSLETNKFITSPEIITHSFTVSNRRYSINEAGTNQYGCYILQQGGDWRRNTNRNLLIKEIYGWNCSNYDIIKTDFYKRDPYGGSNVIVNAPAGDSFYNYDFLFIACSTGDYDDAGDNPLIYPIRTDFGTNYKIGLGINKYYELDGYVLSSSTLSAGPYLYVQGIKFSNPNKTETDAIIDGSIVNLKSNATTIRKSIFHQCSALETIDFPQALTIDEYTFSRCTNLKSINLPLLTTINGAETFSYCPNLKEVILPNVTGKLGATFQSCSNLEKVDLHKLVTLNSGVFSNCSKLKTLILRSSTCCTLSYINALGSTPFANGGSGGTLYVPNDLITTYQSANNWSTILGYGSGQQNQILAIENSPYA